MRHALAPLGLGELLSRRSQRYVCVERGLDDALLDATLTTCPHCGRVGALIGHGMLTGYDERSSERVVRGRRLFCSNRHRRRGCGRTLSVLLASTIKRFSVRAGTLSRLLVRVVAGASPKAAWECVGHGALSLRTGHRLWRRVLAAQAHWRSVLSTICRAPACDDPRPMAQTLAHLRAAVGDAHSVLAGFQTVGRCHVFG